MRAWVDGALLADPTAPAVRLTDRGFTVGHGAFETVAVQDGVPFALELHLARLGRSAAVLGLPPPDVDRVRDAVRAVLGAEPQARARLRITWTAGPGPLGAGPTAGDPTLAVLVDAVGERAAYARVVTVPWPRNERSPLVGAKHTSYAEGVLALAEARRQGADEAVLADTRGRLSEGATSNVFYVVDGELRTPSSATGCLPGVVRALVLRWHGAREVDEPIGVAEQADEVFLTSSTREVQPVARWGGRDLGEPGPVTREVVATWAAHASTLSRPV